VGKEAAVYVPSGTQSNLLALMSHCERGDEYIAGQQAHCYRWEAGGAAVLGSIQPQPIAHQPDGTLALRDIAEAIKPIDSHYARTRLLALENTFGGRILPVAYMKDATGLARSKGLNTHLDGARVFNAVVGLGMDVAEFVAPFDTVSVCLSKGLGAPIGSVLIGQRDLIARARHLRKMLGGGMRQAGIIAAGGLYALENNVARLADDHANAKTLAAGLSRFEGLSVVEPDTNILFVEVAPELASDFNAYLAENGVGLTNSYGGVKQRWVTHLDVDGAAIDAALAVVERFFAN
jgi:threonine aldolase